MAESRANWSYGSAAGNIRNRAMAEQATQQGRRPAALLAIWDGKINNSGTLNMVDVAIEFGMEYFIKKYTVREGKRGYFAINT